MIRLHKILVPTDFSAPSAKAVAYGQALARQFGASLHLLHVVEEPLMQGWEGYSLPVLLPELRVKAVCEARRRLEGMLPQNERDRQPTELVTLEGDPYRAIVRFATERGIDLIVIGTHGRGGMNHLLLGSVAEKVVRSAPCPVLTLRDPEREFVSVRRTA